MRSPTATVLAWIVIVSCAAAHRPLRAQAPAPIDAAERRTVVEQIGTLLKDNYVFPDVAQKSADHLASKLTAGEFNSLTDATAFAERLTKELQSINHDKHMRVRLVPAQQRMQRPDPGAARAQALREMRSGNFGFQRVERLEGNIGYLDLRGFAPVELARPTAVAAMQMLANSDAVIIDVRHNGGGSPDMVQLVSSYLFDKRVHLNSLYWRAGDRTQEFWTLEDVPGSRINTAPVFVLTSGRTFSAGEEFTYNLQTQKRATIIGETTGGGANPGGTFRINERFMIFVPTGRAINPVTRTNWEGVGVKPDIAIKADVALDTALVLARAAAQGHRSASESAEKSSRDALAQGLASATTLLQKQPAEAERAIAAALQKGIAAGILDEGTINALGYEYLGQQKNDVAIAVFEFNVQTFPASSNVWDSLGEAYMNAGQRELAITNYRKSLELDPNNQNAVAMLQKLQQPQ
jgi:hypothetical protein